MDSIQQRFGVILRREREAAGLSQEGLAELAGLHRNYVGLLERGQRIPSLLVIEKLCGALNTSLSRFFSAVESHQ